VWYQQGELVKAERLYQEAAGVFEEIGYKGSLTAVLNNTAEVFFLQGQLERANDTLERAGTYASHSPDPRRSIIFRLNMANIVAERGGYARAMDLYAPILLECRKLGDKSLEGSVLWHRADAHLHQGDLGAAERGFVEGLDLLERQGNTRYVASALFGLGEVRRETGDAKGARAAHERALALRRQMDDKFGVAGSRVALAQLDLDEGRTGEAETSLREAAAIFSAERAPDGEAEAQVMLARALRAKESLAAATEVARRGEAVATNSERPRVRIAVGLELARLLSAKAPPEATRYAEAALAQARQVGGTGLELEARLALAEIEMASGLTQQGRQALVTLEREARQHGFERIARAAANGLGNR
jgi:ATP/maltotriose-dependent transcriptional regulator MalT